MPIARPNRLAAAIVRSPAPARDRRCLPYGLRAVPEPRGRAVPSRIHHGRQNATKSVTTADPSEAPLGAPPPPTRPAPPQLDPLPRPLNPPPPAVVGTPGPPTPPHEPIPDPAARPKIGRTAMRE